jgi:hypothetical protein
MFSRALPPSCPQLAILRGLAQGWRICITACRVGVFDGTSSFKRSLTESTFRQMRASGWIEPDPEIYRGWRLSDAGKQVVDQQGGSQ